VPSFAPWLPVYPYVSFLPFNASGKASTVRVQKTIQTDTVSSNGKSVCSDALIDDGKQPVRELV